MERLKFEKKLSAKRHAPRNVAPLGEDPIGHKGFVGVVKGPWTGLYTACMGLLIGTGNGCRCYL